MSSNLELIKKIKVMDFDDILAKAQKERDLILQKKMHRFSRVYKSKSQHKFSMMKTVELAKDNMMELDKIIEKLAHEKIQSNNQALLAEILGK